MEPAQHNKKLAKLQAKQKASHNKVIRDNKIAQISKDPRRKSHDQSYSSDRSDSPDGMEEENVPVQRKGERKGSTKINAIQNISLRYKKYFPLQGNPMENEFETPELLAKLHKTAVGEVMERPKYSLGNYDSYYNYRYEKRWQDPRLKLLKKDLFLNKNCLDIGCNEGSLTIMIAIRFFPKKIVGLDIDYRLVNKAISNLKYFEKQQGLSKAAPARQEEEDKPEEKPVESNPVDNEKVKQLMEKLKYFPKSFTVNMGIPTNWGHNDISKNKVLAAATDKAVNEVQEEEKRENSMNIENENEGRRKSVNGGLQIENRFPDNIQFQVENYIKDMNILERYDTILCLSTVKWIHFNWGDCGVRRLFKKVYDALRPGGHFVFEPQDWRSYKKRKYFTKEFKQTYKEIQFRPNNFENYLVQRLGFKLVEKLEPDNENVKNEGFKRSIFVFQKLASAAEN